MENITSLVIVGAIVAAMVQYLKKKFGTNSSITLLVVAVISVIAGTIYYFLQNTEYIATIISILGFAGAVYTYILKRFE